MLNFQVWRATPTSTAPVAAVMAWRGHAEAYQCPCARLPLRAQWHVSCPPHAPTAFEVTLRGVRCKRFKISPACIKSPEGPQCMRHPPNPHP